MKLSHRDQLEALRRNEKQMLAGNGLYVDDIRFGNEAYGYVCCWPIPGVRKGKECRHVHLRPCGSTQSYRDRLFICACEHM